VTALEAERQRQLQGATALAIAIRSEVREGWQRLTAAQAAARHFQGVLLPLSQRIVDETQRLYNGMLVGVYDLIRSKQDQIATAREYVGAIRDYWVARAELERALGGPLE
jgi:cobalt-zinc-cadmium efflux system outer membrane protein